MRMRAVAPVLAGLMMLTALPSAAAINKCVSPSGAVTYSDAPCTRYRAAASASAPAAAPVVDVPLPEAAPTTGEATELDGTSVEAPIDAAAPQVVASEPTTGPVRPRLKRSGNWGVVGLGILLLTAAWILHFVVAFRAGQTIWGIVLVLLAPVSSLAYAIFYFRRAWPGWAVGLAGTAIVVAAYVPAADLLDVRDSYLTTRRSYDVDDRRPRETFRAGDTVHLKTVLDWDDWSVQGVHFVMWVWFTDGAPVSNYLTPVPMNTKPTVLLGYMPASSLGEGRHHVELYFDGTLLDRREFRVVQ